MIGFNALRRIDNCMVSAILPRNMTLCETCPRAETREQPVSLGICECGKLIRPIPLKRMIQARLRELRYILDDLPIELGPWQSLRAPRIYGKLRSSQYENMRANIHVTHVWAQSLLLERLVSLSEASTQSTSPEDTLEDGPSRAAIWDMREDLCRQLLHLLSNVSQQNLEPNGAPLVSCVLDRKADLGDLRLILGLYRETGLENPPGCRHAAGMPGAGLHNTKSQGIPRELCRNSLTAGHRGRKLLCTRFVGTVRQFNASQSARRTLISPHRSP